MNSNAERIAHALGYDAGKALALCADILDAVNLHSEAEHLRDYLDPFKTLPALYTNEFTEDPVIPFHIHSLPNKTTGLVWHWFPYEYDKLEGRMFGLVSGFEVELGYFMLDDISDMIVDGSWTPKPLSEVRKWLEENS